MSRALAWLAALVAALGLVGSIEQADSHTKWGKPLGLRRIHAADHGRATTWACQSSLGRRPTRTVYSERHTRSVAYRGWVARLWQGRARFWCRAARQVSDPETAIRIVFGPAGDAAVAVARCESGLSVYAQNGVYLGTFQMGTYARARYGHSWTALGQARAAHRYYLDAGWAPWTCSRIVGVL